MKIVFIGGRDIHKLGGIENYMSNLAFKLEVLGHEPIVFCESDYNGEEYVNGFRVIHQKSLKNHFICKPWLGLKATIYTIVHFRGVDVIHYNAWPPSLWSPVARLCGIPCIMQGHGHEWQRSKYSRREQKILKLMEWYTARINNHVIMCSQDQTEYFARHYRKKATTIPTAINLPEPIADTDILDTFGLQKGNYILFLARLVKDKNPDVLIKAFIKARHDDLKLVIAGNNPADKEFVSYLKSIAKGYKDVVFTDAVYGDDKETLLRNAFAFAIPSTIEGLSISLLEAMSRKVPIIASDIPANKEVLGEKDALWATAEDVGELTIAIENSINNRESFKETAKRNYEFVKENYTWDKVTEKYLNYVTSILHRGRNGSKDRR